jgi:hypothetical protein
LDHCGITGYSRDAAVALRQFYKKNVTFNYVEESIEGSRGYIRGQDPTLALNFDMEHNDDISHFSDIGYNNETILKKAHACFALSEQCTIASSE